MNGFGEYQIRAQTKCFGHAGLPFHYGDRERCLVRTGVARALEQESSILLVVAVHHEGVESAGPSVF